MTDDAHASYEVTYGVDLDDMASPQAAAEVARSIIATEAAVFYVTDKDTGIEREVELPEEDREVVSDLRSVLLTISECTHDADGDADRLQYLQDALQIALTRWPEMEPGLVDPDWMPAPDPAATKARIAAVLDPYRKDND